MQVYSNLCVTRLINEICLLCRSTMYGLHIDSESSSDEALTSQAGIKLFLLLYRLALFL